MTSPGVPAAAGPPAAAAPAAGGPVPESREPVSDAIGPASDAIGPASEPCGPVSDAVGPASVASELAPDDVQPRGGVIDWFLVVLITVLTAWTAVVAVAYLPAYVGSVPLPISVLLGVVAMILAPRACYRLTGSLPAAVAPVVSWFAVTVWLVLARNTLINLPVSVYLSQWRVMLLLGLGSLAAAATVGLIWGDRLRRRIAGEQPAAGS